MSELVRKQLPLFQLLISSKPKLRILILSETGRDFIKAVTECCDNLLKGNIRLEKYLLNRLNKYKQQIRILADIKSKNKVKKQIILQKKGGITAEILSTITPVLHEYFHKNEVCKENGTR
jgi:hypothetical protein